MAVTEAGIVSALGSISRGLRPFRIEESLIAPLQMPGARTLAAPCFLLRDPTAAAGLWGSLQTFSEHAISALILVPCPCFFLAECTFGTPTFCFRQDLAM